MKPSTRMWFDLAQRDLRAAQRLADDEYLANIVIFHCQ